MNRRDRDVLRWFRPWRRRGYTLAWAASGHRVIRDPDGALVTTMSSTPTNPRAAMEGTERTLRRYHGGMTGRAGDGGKRDDD